MVSSSISAIITWILLHSYFDEFCSISYPLSLLCVLSCGSVITAWFWFVLCFMYLVVYIDIDIFFIIHYLAFYGMIHYINVVLYFDILVSIIFKMCIVNVVSSLLFLILLTCSLHLILLNLPLVQCRAFCRLHMQVCIRSCSHIDLFLILYWVCVDCIDCFKGKFYSVFLNSLVIVYIQLSIYVIAALSLFGFVLGFCFLFVGIVLFVLYYICY
jgi:hypothetical protein